MTDVWAHRGASRQCPENTIEAFSRAVELGARGIEFDVQLSCDGHVVVCHDETVDRTSDGTGPVAELSLAQLRALDFATGHPGHRRQQIPLLDEVLELLAPTDVVINGELKNHLVRYPGLAEAVVSTVRGHRLRDRVVVSSFNHRCLRDVAGLAPDLSLAVLYGDDLADPWDYARWLGVQAVHPRGNLLLGRDDVPRFHEAGLAVRTWTVDDPALARAAAEAGVDVVMTNLPQTIAAALA